MCRRLLPRFSLWTTTRQHKKKQNAIILKGAWHFYQFNGQTRWTEQKGSSESNQEKLKYMLNAYRVLLTRARAGMVICVPAGNANKTAGGFWEDSTRLPEYYNGTYQYLKSIGIEEV